MREIQLTDGSEEPEVERFPGLKGSRGFRHEGLVCRSVGWDPFNHRENGEKGPLGWEPLTYTLFHLGIYWVPIPYDLKNKNDPKLGIFSELMGCTPRKFRWNLKMECKKKIPHHANQIP